MLSVLVGIVLVEAFIFLWGLAVFEHPAPAIGTLLFVNVMFGLLLGGLYLIITGV